MNDERTKWIGTWRNQYGSTLEITSEAGGRIEGVFRTALKESSLYGQKPAMIGIHLGDLISFAVGGGETNQIVVGYTGILRDEKIEPLWHMVTGEKLIAEKEGESAEKKRIEAWQAFTTSLYTFERVAGESDEKRSDN